MADDTTKKEKRMAKGRQDPNSAGFLRGAARGGKTDSAKKTATAAKKALPKKAVDNASAPVAESSSTQAIDTSSTETGPSAPSQKEEKRIMATLSLTLDPKTRKSTSVVYKLADGLRGSVRIAKTAFPNGTPPTSLSLQSSQDNAFAEPKRKLTAEERKAARANAPKLTAAQKLQKLQERAAKLQAKIAAEAAAAAPAQ